MSVWPSEASASDMRRPIAHGKKQIVKRFLYRFCCLLFAIGYGLCPAWARSNEAIRAFNAGVQLFNVKKFNEAIPRFDEAISGDSEFAEAYFARGACRYYVKSLDGALMDLNDALRLKPAYVQARSLRGAVNYESDRWDDALADFNDVLETKPNEAQSMLGRAVILLKRNDLTGAARDFRGFLRLRPDDPMAPRVKQILASLKRSPEEPPTEEEGASASGPAEPGKHAARTPYLERLNRMADALLNSPMVDSYTRQVLRGEQSTAVGDIHSSPSVPRQDNKSNAATDIVEPQ